MSGNTSVVIPYYQEEPGILRGAVESAIAQEGVSDVEIIVDETGSGKTTLADIILGLILGLLRPQAGEIRIDGIPLTGANLRAWQNNLGYVPQHIYLRDASVARNIAFGAPDNESDHAAVERVAQIAHIHDFVIDQLPRGYATIVGERGICLSVGQRQRLGIARRVPQPVGAGLGRGDQRARPRHRGRGDRSDHRAHGHPHHPYDCERRPQKDRRCGPCAKVAAVRDDRQPLGALILI
jgi:ABC-type taurine transport system ATPase subunit